MRFMKTVLMMSTLSLVAATAAQAYDGYYEAQQPREWTVQLGGGVMASPEYLGSDEMETDVVPFVRVEYQDVVTFSVPEGLNVKVLQAQGVNGGIWEGEVGVGYDFGREEDDSDNLTGLGDVDDAALLQAKLTHKHSAADVSVQFRQALGGHDGFDVTAAVERGVMLPQYHTVVKYGANIVYGSDDKMEAYHGITAAQAAASPRYNTVYTPDAGFQTTGVNIMASRKVTPEWSLTGIAAADVLLGDAADSPLTEEELQLSVGAFLSYTF